MTATPEETSRDANAAGQQKLRRGRIPADTFSNRLMLARALAGHVSIREACEITGLNRGNWTGWERGLRPRDILDVCQRIAAGLDVDEEWLLFGGPLEGPRGREVRPVTKRSGTDTLQYSPSSVRPSSTRPTAGRPKGRTDRRAPRTPNIGRPVIIDSPDAAIGNRLANAA